MEGRIAEKGEEKEDPKGAKNAKKADPKAKPAKGGKAEAVPDGTVVNVSQYSISPAIG